MNRCDTNTNHEDGMDTTPEPRRLKPEHIYRHQILDNINTLTRTNTSRYTQILGYHKSYDQPTTITHPPLLDQLRAAITGSTGHGGNGSTGFTSKPAARVSALDTLSRIEHAAHHWVTTRLGGTPRTTTEGNLWYLSGATPDLDHHTLADLDHDTQTWAIGASITSGWEAPAWKPHVPCMNCGTTDTIRIRVEPIAGYCVACGEGWDAATIGLLGQHVQLMLDQARAVILAGDHGQDHGSGRGLWVDGTTVLAGVRTDEVMARVSV